MGDHIHVASTIGHSLLPANLPALSSAPPSFVQIDSVWEKSEPVFEEEAASSGQTVFETLTSFNSMLDYLFSFIEERPTSALEALQFSLVGVLVVAFVFVVGTASYWALHFVDLRGQKAPTATNLLPNGAEIALSTSGIEDYDVLSLVEGIVQSTAKNTSSADDDLWFAHERTMEILAFATNISQAHSAAVKKDLCLEFAKFVEDNKSASSEAMQAPIAASQATSPNLQEAPQTTKAAPILPQALPTHSDVVDPSTPDPVNAPVTSEPLVDAVSQPSDWSLMEGGEHSNLYEVKVKYDPEAAAKGAAAVAASRHAPHQRPALADKTNVPLPSFSAGLNAVNSSNVAIKSSSTVTSTTSVGESQWAPHQQAPRTPSSNSLHESSLAAPQLSQPRVSSKGLQDSKWGEDNPTPQNFSAIEAPFADGGDVVDPALEYPPGPDASPSHHLGLTPSNAPKGRKYDIGKGPGPRGGQRRMNPNLKQHNLLRAKMNELRKVLEPFTPEQQKNARSYQDQVNMHFAVGSPWDWLNQIMKQNKRAGEVRPPPYWTPPV